jgi:hypothetical protein
MDVYLPIENLIAGYSEDKLLININLSQFSVICDTLMNLQGFFYSI